MMLEILLLALLTFTSPTTALPPPPKSPIAPTHQQPFIPKPNQPNNPITYNFRPATEADLPAITTITVEAFLPSAAWHYLIPDIKHHKQDIWNCLHDQIVQGWKHFDSNKTFLNVITVPPSSSSSNSENKNNEVPVSFAVWNVRTLEEEEEGAFSSSTSSSLSVDAILQTCLIPPGTNFTRAQDYDRQLQTILQRFFSPSQESVWQDQLYLNLLATHPEWDGNGFGARQVKWGLELSRRLGGRGGGGGGEGREEGNVVVVGEEEEGDEEATAGSIPVTLLSSPAGWPLYESLGFEGVENATIGMLDGLGELWFEVCKWDG
jgi:hypothetical protein